MTKRFTQNRSFDPRAFRPRQSRPLQLASGLGPDLRPRAINLRSAFLTTALATGVLMGASMWSANEAEAGCVDTSSAPNEIFCDAAQTTTDATLDITALGGAANDNVRHYLFTADGDVDVEITPTGDIDGFGLAVETTELGAAIIVDHEGEISIDAGNDPSVGGEGVFSLLTNGGNVTYTGDGSIIDNAGTNIGLEIDTGNLVGGDIIVGTAGNGVEPDWQGTQAFSASSGAGNQDIFLDGGTITTVGDTTFGDAIRMLSSTGNLNLSLEGGTQLINGNGVPGTVFGINAISTSGNITIDSDAEIGTDAARFNTGMNVSTGGVINITQDGNIFASQTGINISDFGVGANPVNVTNAGNIDSGGDGIFVNVATGRNITVTNTAAGNILATGGAAVQVTSGGFVTLDNDGTLNGDPDGVNIANVFGVGINNDGALINGLNGHGIVLTNVGAGGIAISNSFGGAINGLNGDGVNITNSAAAAVAVDNRFAGTITGTDDGIDINTAGNVIIDNRFAGTITGADDGVDLDSVGIVAILNQSGSITGTTDEGVDIDGATSVAINNNDGTIVGGDGGIAVTTVATNVTITNDDGIITGGGDGVDLQTVAGNVTIDNGDGTIAGQGDEGIDIAGVGGNVAILNQDGTVTGNWDGIDLDNVTGAVLIDNRNGGLIDGQGGDGVDVTTAGNVTIDNRFAGTIRGADDGVVLAGVGTVNIANQFGTITGTAGDGVEIDNAASVAINNEDGTITGGESGVVVANVTNQVTISNDDGVIDGQGDEGIEITGVGGGVLVSNLDGEITGNWDGIDIGNVTGVVTVDNRAGGSITGTGGDGVDVDGASAVRILNQGDLGAPGTILGGDDGVVLANVTGGVHVDNSLGGTITGQGGEGVAMDTVGGNVTINNRDGTITGFWDGIDLNAVTGTVLIDNRIGGSITGQNGDGIDVTTALGVTIRNQGTLGAAGTILGNDEGVALADIGADGVFIDNRYGGSITGTNGDGIDVENSAAAFVTVNNRAGGSITGGGDGIDIDDALGVGILNQGGAEPAGTIVGEDDGVVLANIGTGGVFIDNRFEGSITGNNDDGIDVDGSGGDVTILNRAEGNISGGDDGVDVDDVVGNVLIDNRIDGVITGGDNGVEIATVTGDVFVDNRNRGSITGTNEDGVEITGVTGTVTVANQFGGEITGGETGIEVNNAGSDVTVTNEDGTITGQADEGIAMDGVAGNVVINNLNGSITGFWDGIDLNNVAGTVFVENRSGGSIVGQGGDGIDVTTALGVTIRNQGTLGAAGTIQGDDDGVALANIGTEGVLIDNRFGGSIVGTNDNGVDVQGSTGDVTVLNRANGVISGGDDGVDIDVVNGDVVVDNRIDGSITGGDNGVEVENVTGMVTVDNRNRGSISGGNDGVQIVDVTGTVLVDNRFSGSITGTDGDGVDVEDVDGNVTVDNRVDGVITGEDSGVEIDEVTGNVLVDNRDGGDIFGNDDGVEIFNIEGNVTVDNRFNGHIEGFGEDGVAIDDVEGDVFIDNGFAALIRGDDDGVNIGNVTGNVVVDNSAGSLIHGVNGDGIDVDGTDGDVTILNDTTSAIIGGVLNGVDGETGLDIDGVTGTTLVENDGLIQGAGTADEAVIDIDDNGGEVVIANDVNGVIGSGNLPETDPAGDWMQTLADSRADLAEFRGFDNFFGGGMEIPSGGTIVTAELPSYIDAADDVVLDVESDMAIDVDNDGFLVGRGLFDSDDRTLVVNNADGVWLTSGLNTFTGSDDDVVRNHGLVQTAFDATVDEVTEFDELDTFDNRGVLSMMDGVEGDRTEISGDYVGTLGEAHLAVDTFFGPPGVGDSDVLAIGGDMNGSTAVVINKTNAVPGGLNDEGITVVEIGGDTENDCFGVLCQVGDAGFISEQSEDFFAFDGHNFVHDNGLFLWGMTQRDGEDPVNSELVLVSDIGPHAAQLPTLITAAQNVWYESTSVVEDHIYGLRYGVAPGYAPLADTPVDDGLYRKGPVAPAPVVEQPARSAAWLKVYGSRTDQDTSVRRNFNGTGTELEFDTGFEQDTLGIMGGADFGNKIAPDVMFRFGIFGGYTDSDMDFDRLGSSADLRGPLVGGYVSYSSGGFYVDAMGRADFLEMDFDSPTLPGGFDGVDDNKATSVGVLANVGFRHQMGSAFLEPIGSFAYVATDMDSFEVSDANVRFSDDESLRLGGGGRFGGTLFSGPTHAIEASILGKVWHEFEDNTVTITDAFDAQTAVSDDAKGTFGEVTGSVTAYGLDRSWSVFVSGGAKFNDDFVTYGGKGGVRYSF